MLINYRAFFNSWETIEVGVVMIVVATVAKYAAAWLTQKTFRMSVDQRRVIFGLSNAQAAATLAAVMVGYNVILGHTDTGEPVRLLNESVLNGTILMILVTCTMASFSAQKGAQNLALADMSDTDSDNSVEVERILIPVSYEHNVDELVNLSTVIKSKKNKSGLYALNVVDSRETDEKVLKRAKKILNQAVVTASAADNHVQDLIRYDLSIVNAIIGVIKERNITDLVLGLHKEKGISTSFLGKITEGLLSQSHTTTLIYKPAQPLATIKRHLVVVPDKAEKEVGFTLWVAKIWQVANNTGAKIVF